MSPAEPILSFDTATNNCSIALTKGSADAGRVIALFNLGSDTTHSRRLLGSIEKLLEKGGIGLNELSAIAVGLGPGSFTGLRIGMATAKGLCHGLGIPLLGISSLDAIGCQVRSDKLICAVLDARKKEVYSCFYRYSGQSFAKRCSEPMVLAPRQLAESINEPVIMAGDGVDVYSTVFAEVLGNRLEKAGAEATFPAADVIGFLAEEQRVAENFLDLAEAVPTYIRSSDAELSLKRPVPKGNVHPAREPAGRK
jgi:tRNA threonylcarbamoyladenosine biosynthesis protein TsaB